MNRVQAYFQSSPMPQAPQAPKAPSAAPRLPVSAMGVDGYAKTSAEVAEMAGPFAPGVVGGATAKSGIARAQGFFRQADRTKRFGSRVKATRAGRNVAVGGVAMAIRRSVIVGGLLSLVANGYAVFKGEQKASVASGKVAGDLAASAVGGAAAAGVSALGTAMLAPSIGTGFGLTLAGIALGVAAFAAAELLVRRTALHQRLEQGTERLVAQLAE